MDTEFNTGTELPTRLKKHVRTLAETFFPRDHEHPENLDRAAAYISDAMRRAGGAVSDQEYDVRGRKYRNVIARFGPETIERVVVGAHYDAAGELPAADDNASGVAGLIELGYLLVQAKLPLRVELVAYSLEEPPYFGSRYMGSYVHAQALKEQKVQVRAMLSLEMIGYFSDEPGSQRYPVEELKAIYPAVGNFISVVGNLGQEALVKQIEAAMRTGAERSGAKNGGATLPVYSLNAPRMLSGVDLSDHRNYWDAGYPAVMVTNTAFYRNPNYHTAADTPDTLEYQRMALVVQAVLAAVLALAH